MLLAGGAPEMLPEHLPAEMRSRAAMAEPLPTDLTLRAAEQRHIERVLALAGGNHTQAAKLLGMSRQGLYNRLEEFGFKSESA